MRYRRTAFLGNGPADRRTVYQDPDLDPGLVIPAGTRFSNGRTLQRSISNLELMRNGRAPFLLRTEEDGTRRYVPVELHHTVQGETNHGAEFWGSSMVNGPVVELGSDFHDENSRVLHYITDRGSSFRVDTLTGGKSEDAEKYDDFRQDYWKARAADYEGQEGLFEREPEMNTDENIDISPETSEMSYDDPDYSSKRLVLRREITPEIRESRERDTEAVLDAYRDNLRDHGVTDESKIEEFVNTERDKINAEYDSLDRGDLESNRYYTPTDWEEIASEMRDDEAEQSTEDSENETDAGNTDGHEDEEISEEDFEEDAVAEDDSLDQETDSYEDEAEEADREDAAEDESESEDPDLNEDEAEDEDEEYTDLNDDEEDQTDEETTAEDIEDDVIEEDDSDLGIGPEDDETEDQTDEEIDDEDLEEDDAAVDEDDIDLDQDIEDSETEDDIDLDQDIETGEDDMEDLENEEIDDEDFEVDDTVSNEDDLDLDQDTEADEDLNDEDDIDLDQNIDSDQESVDATENEELDNEDMEAAEDSEDDIDLDQGYDESEESSSGSENDEPEENDTESESETEEYSY